MAGIFGRLARWKGQHIALEALAKLPDAHLAIVGSALFGDDADYAAQLRRRATELGIAARIHFMGFRDDIPALMKAMDVVIHASTAAEPFGRVIVEAMLARRPVIATAAGGVLEIVTDGVTGLLVKPNDPAALTATLKRLQRDPGFGNTLGARGYQQAVTRFGLKAYVAKMIEYLDTV